jgi:hypothetical protein
MRADFGCRVIHADAHKNIFPATLCQAPAAQFPC